MFGAGCATMLSRNGFPQHTEHLHPTQISEIMKWITFAELESFISLFFLRASIALFLLRILDSVSLRTKYLLYTVTGLNAMVMSLTVIIAVVQCIPLQAIWDSSIQGRCFSNKIFDIVARVYGCKFSSLHLFEN